MDEYTNAIRLLNEAKKARTKAISDYWRSGKTNRQVERMEASMKWCERRKSQLIEIIKHL